MSLNRMRVLMTIEGWGIAKRTQEELCDAIMNLEYSDGPHIDFLRANRMASERIQELEEEIILVHDTAIRHEELWKEVISRAYNVLVNCDFSASKRSHNFKCVTEAMAILGD